jgi:hypothetical protein
VTGFNSARCGAVSTLQNLEALDSAAGDTAGSALTRLPKTKSPLVSGPSSNFAILKIWSGRRDSNPRPRPWQGRALPLSYTRIREIGGDHSPATGRAMPNAARECNSPRAARNRSNGPILNAKAANWPETACEWRLTMTCHICRREPKESIRDRSAMVWRSDSSHFPNQPRSVPAHSSRPPASQSNVAYHSTNARLPSTMGVMRKVA